MVPTGTFAVFFLWTVYCTFRPMTFGYGPLFHFSFHLISSSSSYPCGSVPVRCSRHPHPPACHSASMEHGEPRGMSAWAFVSATKLSPSRTSGICPVHTLLDKEKRLWVYAPLLRERSPSRDVTPSDTDAKPNPFHCLHIVPCRFAEGSPPACFPPTAS